MSGEVGVRAKIGGWTQSGREPAPGAPPALSSVASQPGIVSLCREAGEDGCAR